MYRAKKSEAAIFARRPASVCYKRKMEVENRALGC